MKKRLITFALVIAMMATMIPSAFAATLPADVSDSWCKEYVADLIDKGVVNGYPDGTYRPNTNLSRGAIAKMAFMSMKAAGSSLKESTENNPFADTKGDWAEGYIAVLANTGNILPSEFGYKYEANKDMSRLDTAKLLVRIYQYAHPNEKLAGTATLNFTDASEISAADAPLVAKAVELGIITGYEDGSFKPSASINRATAAAMVSRFLKTVGNISDPAEFAVSTGGNGQISTDTTGAPEVQNVEWVIKPTLKLDSGIYISDLVLGDFSVDGIGAYRETPTGEYTFIDSHGKTYQYADASIDPSEGFRYGYAPAISTVTNKCGMIDISGKWVIEPKYDGCYNFEYTCYNDGTKILACAVKMNGTRYYLDKNFNVIENYRDRIKDIDRDATDIANNEQTYRNFTIDGEEESSFSTTGGLRVYSKLLGSGFLRKPYHGICDKNGRVILRPTPATGYSGSDPLHGSYDRSAVHPDCIVLEHMVYTDGCVDDIYDGTTGKLISSCAKSMELAQKYNIPFRYIPNLHTDYGEGLFVVSTTDKFNSSGTHADYGYMDRYCNMVIPAVFEDALPFSNGYAWVKYDGLWGVIKLPNF